jgi:phage host-nuclease inhibitor protein Gam
MKSKRIKIPLIQLTSREEAEAAMTSLSLAANNQRRDIAERDALILAINKRFEARLASHDLFIKEKSEALRAWAEANPDQFPRDRKSIQFVSGVLGFRTGTPKLALLSRAWTWKKVLAKVSTLLPGYVRKNPEVDKDAILASRHEAIMVSTLPTVGLKVVQDETFFIDPALADTDARQSVTTSEAA